MTTYSLYWLEGDDCLHFFLSYLNPIIDMIECGPFKMKFCNIGC